jgi:hypothetical protein
VTDLTLSSQAEVATALNNIEAGKVERYDPVAVDACIVVVRPLGFELGVTIRLLNEMGKI